MTVAKVKTPSTPEEAAELEKVASEFTALICRQVARGVSPRVVGSGAALAVSIFLADQYGSSGARIFVDEVSKLVAEARK